MNWFRFYSEALDDPKVQRLPGDLFKAWVNLLCLANKGRIRGVLPSTCDIAFALRMDEGQVESIVDRLIAAELLEYNALGDLVPHGWEGRQAASDDAAARKRAQRAKTEQAPDTDPDPSGVCPVTSPVTRNGTSTEAVPVTRPVLEKNRIETEESRLDESTDRTRAHEAQQREAFDRELPSTHRDPPGTPVNRQRKAPRPVPEIPLPPSYPLTEEMRVWLAQEIPELRDPDTEHRQFCRHWHSKQNETRTDWRPMWEKWMTDAVTRFAPRATSTGETTRERSRYESPAERKEREWLESFSYRTRDPDSGWDSGQPPALPGGTSYGEVIELDSRRVG